MVLLKYQSMGSYKTTFHYFLTALQDVGKFSVNIYFLSVRIVMFIEYEVGHSS